MKNNRLCSPTRRKLQKLDLTKRKFFVCRNPFSIPIKAGFMKLNPECSFNFRYSERIVVSADSLKIWGHGVKPSLSFERSYLSPQTKMKKSEAPVCRSALLLSFYENHCFLSQWIKKLNSTERGAPFRHFSVSKVITAHAHKSGVIFHIFPRPFNQKKKRLYHQRWLK